MPLKEESFERINFGNWENCYTFASHITDYRTVRWVSGLNQQFAKLPYGLPYRGFESPPHRKRVQRGRRTCSSGFFVPFCKARRQAGGDVRPQGANPPVRIPGAWLLGCATVGSKSPGEDTRGLAFGMCDRRKLRYRLIFCGTCFAIGQSDYLCRDIRKCI